VATPAFFIGRGEVENVMGHLQGNPLAVVMVLFSFIPFSLFLKLCSSFEIFSRPEAEVRDLSAEPQRQLAYNPNKYPGSGLSSP
jgi:hypothetical protein